MLAGLEIPEAYSRHLKIGTCSWKYDSWKGLVYDPDRVYRARDCLADYAKHFHTVEVDQWFWSLFPGGVKLPDPGIARDYAESTPDGLVFTVKAPNSITLTHHYAKQPKGSEAIANQPNPHFLDVELLVQFLDTLRPLGNKLGPVMFQFEYLNKTKMPSRQAFLEKLEAFFAKAPKGFQYAVELRNPNYLTRDVFQFLRGHGIGYVLLDGYVMPPIAAVAAGSDVRTAGYSVIRLHGPDREKMEEQTQGHWDQIIAPKDTGLQAVVQIIQGNSKAGVTTYVNVNNHYEGSAPLTIQRLAALL